MASHPPVSVKHKNAKDLERRLTKIFPRKVGRPRKHSLYVKDFSSLHYEDLEHIAALQQFLYQNLTKSGDFTNATPLERDLIRTIIVRAGIIAQASAFLNKKVTLE